MLFSKGLREFFKTEIKRLIVFRELSFTTIFKNEIYMYAYM